MLDCCPLSARRLGLAVIAFLAAHQLATAEPTTRPPNLVLIFADDMGWKDVGYQSEQVFLTPVLDRLCGEGMVFTDAYASAGNCAPSRACLLSGLYTPRHEVYAVGDTNRGPRSLQRLIPIPNRRGLGPRFRTIAEVLRDAGYATGHFGKWHLAGADGALPSQQGFQQTYDSFGDGELTEGTETNKKGPPEDPKGVFTLTRKACDFIEANRDRPFFCYLAHHAIHTPLQARQETRDKVASRTGPGKPSVNYLGCTYDLDASVGRLLDTLRELDLEKNTLVLFTSDNGATPRSSQEPLRGNKGGYYEGGIREPFIARWPGVIPAGARCSIPVINVDIFPTFLDAAGVTPDPSLALDGESLMPLLKQSGELKRDAIFWHFPGYLDRPVTRGRDPVFRTRPVSVIRKGDWKLHLYHEEWKLDGGRAGLPGNAAVELYDLRRDIGERNELSAERPEKRDELLKDLLAWFDHADARLPSKPNPQYNPDQWEKRGKNQRKKRRARGRAPEDTTP